MIKYSLDIHYFSLFQESSQHTGGPWETRGLQPGNDGAGSTSLHPQRASVQPVSGTVTLSLLSQGKKKPHKGLTCASRSKS